MPIPFGPPRGEIAELVAVRTEIPRFGNQLYTGHHRILPDRVEKCAALSIFAIFTPQRCAEVEAEPVDMHLQCPVAQRIHDELQHPRVIKVQCIARASNVLIKTGVGVQSVI